MASPGFVLPATAHCVAVIGADFSMTVECFSDEHQAEPFPLTGCKAEVQIGNLYTLPATISKPPSAGTIVVSLTAEQTNVLPAAHHYTLKVTDKDGGVSFPLSGDIEFRSP